MATTGCWSGFCIAGDCDGLRHVDATGHTWTEAGPEQVRQWLKIGLENRSIRGAWDPAFTAASFTKCHTIDELQHQLTRAMWCVGAAFYLEDLCMINQVDGGDEWLVVRHGIAFESFTVGPMVERGSFPETIERVLAATAEQCRNLTY